ncbi:carboxypeptidase regulatory-like domain-containing protein, partial [Candidatus Thorarchaeota archaeon]
MNRFQRLTILATLLVLFMLPLSGNESADTTDQLYSLNDHGLISGYQDEATWWNSTFIYRRYFNFTEPDVSERSNLPVHLYLTFEDGHCYRESIRVLSYNGPGSYDELDFQTWNTTFYPGSDFVKSTRVSFIVDVARDGLEDSIYIYYAKEDVGSVDNSGFYPFVYRSYTFSLINLVSYYEANNFYIEMWDDPLFDGDGTWKNPNDVSSGLDTRWKNSQVTPSSTPSGTLNRYENVRYEPTASDYNDFWGYYSVYSNYPLAVSMGQGDKGSNPAVNDWWPGVNELGEGLGMRFILGGVEGFESRNEGKYWVQAHEDDTEVYVWTTGDTLDSGWLFYNGSSVASWPAILDAGEYISKRDVVYTTYLMANSTKPVSMRAGDSDSSYARDIGGYFPATTGELVGYEFYTIDMGNSNDKTRVTNIWNSSVTVEWWRNTGSGWVKGANLTDIPVNGSATIPSGTSSSSNQEDLLHIRAPQGSRIFVEGVYNIPSVTDYGDWAPTMTGKRFGLDYRIWGGREQKIMIMAWENAEVKVSSYSGSTTLEIAAGDIDYYMPVSSSQSLHDIHSNSTISVVVASRFSTSGTNNPSGDQGYGWMVPTYASENDEAGLLISASDEIKLFEFDIMVSDLDGAPVGDVTVTLYNTDGSLWYDDNGLSRSGTTNANGMIVFEGLSDQTYRIVSTINAAEWLSSSYDYIWVTDTTDNPIEGSVTYIDIQLDLANIDVYLTDLMGDPMSDNDNEDTNLRLNNGTGNWQEYIAQAKTNTTGWAHFHRVPQDDYVVYSRYAGSLGWSYGYDQLTDFASYSLAAGDFSGGSFTRAWDLPLITLDVHVTSWDELDVPQATIKINNSVDENQYQITKAADENGDYSFYRIVNGTWNLDVWKADDYADTPLARNFTVSLSDLQDYHYQNMRLPLSRLIIRVQTGPTTYVEGAQVNVTLKNVGIVAQGVTNSTGHVTFFNIHANMSMPYFVAYNVTVQSGNQQNGTISELFVKCDYDYLYVNRIFIGVPLWSSDYTELNATSYFINVRWGRNATVTAGWYDKTGDQDSYTTGPISFDGTSWLNFTIYYDTLVVGSGYWTQSTSSWVGDPSGINFLLTIDTDFWKMNVSANAYRLVISADTSAKDAPAPITIYVTVQAAETSKGIGTADIDEFYGTHGQHLYWLTDLTNGGFVDNLDVYTFEVKSGTATLNSGSLLENLNDTYTLSEAALSGLGVGSYVITITLEKANYINQTITVYATISALPMEVSISTPADYEWSIDTGSEAIVFQYVIDWNDTATVLSGVNVRIEWLTYPAGISYRNVTRVLSSDAFGDFTYVFDGNVVPVGSWTVRISCIIANYSSATGQYGPLVVSEASTTFLVPPAPVTVDWTEPAVFVLDYSRNGDGLGLEGADISTNWNGTVVVEYLGGGIYSVSFDTTIPADTYSVTIEISLSNHESQQDSVSITIRVPIFIESVFGSEETPLVAYWTRSFNVTIRLIDLSRTDTVITGATVSYDWDDPIFVSSGGMTEISPGVYQVTLNANDASPLVNSYKISVDAQKDLSSATGSLFLELQDVPNEIVLRQGGYVPYYGDVATVWFYWNNTLDNEPITLPSSASFTVEPLETGIGGFNNYGNGSYSFDVDTSALGMNVDDYSGFYRIRISMLADGFEELDDVFVFFLMRESPSELQLVGDVQTGWGEQMTIMMNLRDTRHDVLVWDAAMFEIWYDGELLPIPVVSYGNGTFYAQFDTSDYFIARAEPYDVMVMYSIPNYVDGSLDIELTVDPVVGEIDILPGDVVNGTYSGTWTDVVEIELTVVYEDSGLPLPEGVATYYWLGYQSVGGTLSYSGFRYEANVDTSLVPAGTRTLRIEIALENHTVVPFDVVMTLDSVVADFEADVTELEGVYGSSETNEVRFDLTYSGTPLADAEVTLILGSREFGADIEGTQYVVSFSLSQVSGLQPGLYLLNFTMELQNYTAQVVQIPLRVLAPTSLSVSTISLEMGQSVTFYIGYYDTLTGQAIPIDVGDIVVRLPNDALVDVTAYNSTHFSVTFVASEVGEIRTEPYVITVEISAEGYQSYTSENPYEIDVYIEEPTYNFGPLGKYPVSTVNTIGFMILLFAIGVGAVAAVRSARIPYQIKQINKALKQIEKGKTGKVEKIKTMGQVISEVLAPGLAELDIEAPVIEMGPEATVEEILD